MSESRAAPRIFMMDLLATVPYYTAYLSKALLAEGVNLRVGSISYYLDPECFSSRGVPLHPGLINLVGRHRLPPPVRRGLKLAETIINMAALTIRFAVVPPAVVHVQYLPMLRWRLPLDAWFVAFCRWRGSKVVLTVHDLLPHDTAETYREVFQKLYRRVDGIICHSRPVSQRLQEEFGVAEAKIAIIPHGPFFYDLPVAGDDALGLEIGRKRVLWQGIIFPYKGLDVLLRAWRRVEAKVPEAMLVVAGTGAPQLLEQVEQQVRALGLTRVQLLLRFATTAELVAMYRAADVVVYPYRAITTSGALATGLALGKAIVASDLAVFRELLTSGSDALLVEPGNEEALAEAIVKLLNEPELRKAFEAATRAKDFGARSWSMIAAETIKVYQTVLGAHE